jgi:uncharacterized protein (DUF427 family)
MICSARHASVVTLPGYHGGPFDTVEHATMPRAFWNGTLIAASDRCEIVEGNRYFPPADVKQEFLRDSDTHTVCGWKGTASYYDVVVDGKVNRDAAWYYQETKPAAANVRGYIAFWKGVQIED